MGRGRNGVLSQSKKKKSCNYSAGLNEPKDGFFSKTSNQTNPDVNIQPELMNLLKNTDPAFLVHLLTL